MINKKVLNYDQKLLCAWLRFNAGCSSPEYFNAQKGDQNLELQQVPEEYSQLLMWFKQQNFESYLELGVGRGGSFLLNVMFQSNLKTAVCVDNSAYWKEDQEKSIREKLEWLSKEKMPMGFVASSTDEYFQNLLVNDSAKFDCIFIDADHSYEGVKKDFDNSLKHIKDGGYIIFHDIASNQCPGVKQLWLEAARDHKAVHSFVFGSNCGIGIIQVNKKEILSTPNDKGEIRSIDILRDLTPIEKMMLNKSKYGVLLIETRPEINLEEVAQRHMKFLPESWGLTIIGSKENEQIPCPALNRIHVNIQDFSINVLNKWLTSPYFWSLIPHEKVLIIQHDSQLLRTGIEEFLEWDYVGAPWKFSEWGGNGGLSLRTVSVMKEVCEKHTYHGEAMSGNEDIFFSTHLHNGMGKLAPRAVCEKFSCESIFKLGTLGEHAANKYLTTDEYQQIINQYK